MNEIWIDGQKKELAVPQERSLHALLEEIENGLGPTQRLIASIRVDGIDVSPSDRTDLSEVPISEFNCVEIATSHPREIADDTLRSLMPYVGSIADLCRDLALEANCLAAPEFRRILDGLDVLIEATGAIRNVMNVTELKVIDELESELMIILKELVQGAEARDQTKCQMILSHVLPENLDRWKNEGLPALQRSRDS